MAKIIDLGSLPPDDPIYSAGPVIGAKRFRPSSKTSKATKVVGKSSQPRHLPHAKAVNENKEKDSE
jgi:hypothetical protein